MLEEISGLDLTSQVQIYDGGQLAGVLELHIDYLRTLISKKKRARGHRAIGWATT